MYEFLYILNISTILESNQRVQNIQNQTADLTTNIIIKETLPNPERKSVHRDKVFDFNGSSLQLSICLAF